MHPRFFPNTCSPLFYHYSIPSLLMGLNGSKVRIILTGCVATFSSSNFNMSDRLSLQNFWLNRVKFIQTFTIRLCLNILIPVINPCNVLRLRFEIFYELSDVVEMFVPVNFRNINAWLYSYKNEIIEAIAF